MMIETDMLYAFVKRSDWLKPVAEELMLSIRGNRFGAVYASREALHELYYISLEEGVPLDEVISRVAALTMIDNLVFLDTTAEIDLLALTIMKQYGITSVFDAYHAATVLNQVPDHTIISMDQVFDKIPGLNRVDPHTLVGT